MCKKGFYAPRDNASIRVVLQGSQHAVRFTGSRLAVGKYCSCNNGEEVSSLCKFKVEMWGVIILYNVYGDVVGSCKDHEV